MARTKKNIQTINNTKYTTSIIRAILPKHTNKQNGKKKSKKNYKKYKNTKYFAKNGRITKINIYKKSQNNRLQIQNAGFLAAIKHWKNMRKFNNFVGELQKEERQAKNYLGSYKVIAIDFKNLAEDKRDKTTEYVLNRRQLKIIELIQPKDADINSTSQNNKNYLSTLMSSHDLEMIEKKQNRLEIDINQANNSINKKLSEFIKDKIALDKNTKKFRDTVDKISSGELGNFQSKVKLLKKEYDAIAPQAKGTLKSVHKKALKKYLSHKADYEKVVKIDETYIQKQQELVHEINDLLSQGQFYIDQMDSLDTKREKVDTDIVKWEEIYTKIYELIKKILDSIKKTKKIIEEIKQIELEINISIHPIAQTSPNKIIQQSSKELKNKQQELENVIKYLDASAANINEVLGMLLNEKMASELYLDTTKIATAFLSTVSILENYKNIFKPIGKQQPGGALLLVGGRNRHSRRGRGGPAGGPPTGRPPVGRGVPLTTPAPTIGTFGPVQTPFVVQTGQPPFVVQTGQPPRTIHSICYKQGVNKHDFEEILKLIPRNQINSVLFIYIDDFDSYASNDSKQGTNHTEKFRNYRQDITTINNGGRSLGIPIGFTTAEQTKITPPLASLSNITFTTGTGGQNSYVRTKSNNFQTINDVQTLFIDALQNIYKYISTWPKITDIIVYSYCNNNTTLKATNKLDFAPYIVNPSFTHSNKKFFKDGIKQLFNELKNKFNFNIDTSENINLAYLANLTPPQNLQTPLQAPALQIPQAQYQTNVIQIYLSNTNTKIVNDYVTDINDKIINLNDPTKIYISDNGPITNKAEGTIIKLMNGITGIIKSGKIYIDPSRPENSPIRSILNNMDQLNKTSHQYDNNIKLVEDNMNNIYDLISEILKDKSDFMLLTENIQELSQYLIKLKYIEPKVINVELDKPTPLAKKYSWILKPVELNKSEFHALTGTQTLDQLIQTNKAMNEMNKQFSYVSEPDIENLINLLSHQNIHLNTEDSSKLQKIDIRTFVDRAIYKASNITDNKQKSNYLCNIYKNIKPQLGQFIVDKYKSQLCPSDKQENFDYPHGNRNSGRGGRGRRRR